MIRQCRTALSSQLRQGRQALVLFGGVVLGFVLGTALGAPFDMDVGAGPRSSMWSSVW